MGTTIFRHHSSLRKSAATPEAGCAEMAYLLIQESLSGSRRWWTNATAEMVSRISK